MRSWSLMSTFQQIVDRSVLPLPPPPFPPRDWLCARLISDHLVSLGAVSQRSSLRCVAHKSLALKWLIKNQLKMITIGREYQRGRRRGPRTDVSVHTSHAYQTHYCCTQTLPAKPNGCHNWAMFGRGVNFLAKGRWKRRNGFKHTYRSSRTCQPGGPQAAADGAVTRTALPKGCIFKGSLCLFYLLTTKIKY